MLIYRGFSNEFARKVKDEIAQEAEDEKSLAMLLQQKTKTLKKLRQSYFDAFTQHHTVPFLSTADFLSLVALHLTIQPKITSRNSLLPSNVARPEKSNPPVAVLVASLNQLAESLASRRSDYEGNWKLGKEDIQFGTPEIPAEDALIGTGHLSRYVEELFCLDG